LDHACLEFLQLLLVVTAHPFQQLTRGARLGLIDLRDGKADVNQHPVTHADPIAVAVEQTNVDGPPHAGDIDLGQASLIVEDLENLAWDGKAHRGLTSLSGSPAR